MLAKAEFLASVCHILAESLVTILEDKAHKNIEVESWKIKNRETEDKHRRT